MTPTKGKDYPNATWLTFMTPCAKQAGLDTGAINTCLKSGKVKTLWSEIKKYGHEEEKRRGERKTTA